MIIKKEVHDSLICFFSSIYQGDNNAINLSMDLFYISQVWDDLIDGASIDGSEINKAFVKAMFSLPTNPLSRAMPELPYHVYNVFLRWRDSTSIESDSPTDDDLNKCYMLRAGIYDIFVLICAHLYGDDYAAEIGPYIRRFYGETLTNFKLEFKNA